MERGPRGRAQLHRHVLRQHRRARRRHLAARRVHRAAGAGAPDAASCQRERGRLALADVLGRLQALHRTPACLDVCPTGALFRTEFGTVVVQQDICNGCGYCVPACPFGVIDRREDDGRAGSARCATTGSATARARPAPRPAPPSRSSSARSTSCASARRSGSTSCTRPGSPRRGCTARTRTTASAAPGRSSCCSTSPRSTACRPIRSSPPGTCPRCGAVAIAARAVAGALAACLGGVAGAGHEQAGAAGHGPGWPGGSDAGGTGPGAGSAAAAGPGRPAGAAGAVARRAGRWCHAPSSSSYYGRPVLKEPVWQARTSRATCSSAGWPARRRVLAAGAAGRAPRPGPARPRSAPPAPSGCPLRRPGARPRPAGPLRQHAAGVQAHVADERRLLAARRLRPAGGRGRRQRRDRAAAAGRRRGHRRGAPLLGPGVATYTAALLCDTAVPAWHEGYREMPFVFAGSAATAGGRPGHADRAPGARQARDPARGAGRRDRADRQEPADPADGRDRGAVPGRPGRARSCRRARYLTAAGLAGAVLTGRSRRWPPGVRSGAPGRLRVDQVRHLRGRWPPRGTRSTRWARSGPGSASAPRMAPEASVRPVTGRLVASG